MTAVANHTSTDSIRKDEIHTLCRHAKAHIEKGDKAADKAQQHYIAAGQHIASIKQMTPDQAAFLEIVKLRIGLGKSRTYELLQIADGTKTVEEVQAATNQRKIKHRKTPSVPERTGDKPPLLDDDMPTAEEAEEAHQETLFDQACLFLELMTSETRQTFLAHLKENEIGPAPLNQLPADHH